MKLSSFMNQYVLELPGIFEVEAIVNKLISAVFKGIPVGVVPTNRADVLLLNLQATFVVHFVSIDKTSLWIFQSPNHSCKNGRGDLKCSCVLVGCAFSGVFNGKLRTIPIRIFGMTVEQHSQLIHARHDLLLQNSLFLEFASRTDSLKRWSKRIRARMVCVVAGGSKFDFSVFANSEEISNRDSLIVSYQEADLRTICRTPTLHSDIHSRLCHVNGGLTSLSVEHSLLWNPLFMCSPTKFWRHVETFNHQAFDWPSVPDLFRRTELVRALSISLSDVNSLDSEVHHEMSPFAFILGYSLKRKANILGDVKKCLFDEPADHSGIGSTSWDSCCFQAMFSHISEKFLSNVIVAFLLNSALLMVTCPSALSCIDVEDSFCLAVLGNIWGGNSDRKVDAESNFSNKDFIKDFFEIVGSEPYLHEFHIFWFLWGFNRMGIDDGDAIILKVTSYEREGPFGYRSVANYADIVYLSVNFLCFHQNFIISNLRNKPY